ncbi:MAG: putative fatty-acid--CoA ligase, partial [Desertimonas sp.]|nr:putative fatty-acid--CoA ligase [Desertimonas sp.]
MTEIEVRGAPMRVFNSAPPTMRAIWELTQFHAAKPYVVFEDESYTYAEIGAQVRALAHHLRDGHGVGSGDRVAIAMRNYPEWVVSYWATLCVGAAVVGVNAWWTTQELAYGLADSRPKVLIA